MVGIANAQMLLASYALLLIMGGITGYRKAGSRPSLIAGSISGAVALIALGISFQNFPVGIELGIALGVAMLIVFSIRFAKTRKVMPSGMMLIFSLIEVGLLVASLVGRAPQVG